MASPDKAGRVIAGLLGYNPGPGIYSRLERAVEEMPSSVRAEIEKAPNDLPATAMLSRHLLEHTDASVSDWRRIDEYLRDQGVGLRGVLGAGEERLAMNAVGRGGEPYVFKVGGGRQLYDLPDAKGVIPYLSRGSEGGLNFGLQPKAARVYSEGGWAPDGVPREEQYWWWEDLARDVQQSLYARGYSWDDASASNVGIMPDNSIGVIDGSVRRWGERFTPVIAR